MAYFRTVFIGRHWIIRLLSVPYSPENTVYEHLKCLQEMNTVRALKPNYASYIHAQLCSITFNLKLILKISKHWCFGNETTLDSVMIGSDLNANPYPNEPFQSTEMLQSEAYAT